MNRDTTDLEQRSHVKVFRTPRPKPPHLLDPLNNNIRVRLKSIQSPNTTKNGPSDTLMLNPFSATTLSLGLSPAVASLSHFRKKSTGDSLRNEFPKLESSDSLVSTPRVKPESNRGKTMLLYPSSSKFGSTSFKKKGSLIDFSESQDHNILSPQQGKANNKDEVANQPTFGSLTERKGLPQSIFAPKNDKVRLLKETEFKKKKVEKKLKVTDDFPIIPVKISKNLNLQTPKHSPYISISAPNSTKASETGKSSGIKDWSAIATPKTKADAIKEENLMMDLESQEERKKRIVDLMSKELENRWGIRQISQETPISHNNDNEDGTPQSGEIFSDEGDRKDLPDELISENNRDLRIDLTENESESQVRKKPDRGDLKSRTRKLGTRKSVVFKTKEEFRGLGDLSGFRSMPRKNDVFSDSCVDFFQFNERNRFYDEFSEGFKQEPAQPHPIRDMENRDSAMMVAFNQNDKIIQPAFMQRVGSMCFTEFWTKKINLVFFKKIKKSSQYLRLNEPGRENETVYRPGKWKKEAFTKEKIMEHSSAWTTKSVALMKALEKQDGDSPTSTKAALSLFKKTQTPHVAENPWVNTDNETFTLAQKLRNTKPSLAIDSRGVSLESARHQHKQEEQSRFRKDKQTHLPNDIEDIYLKNIRKARLAKAGHYPVTEDKLNSNNSIHRSKSSIRPPLTAR